jgi:hypothetical protein
VGNDVRQEHVHVRGQVRGQNRNAKRPTEEFEPTTLKLIHIRVSVMSALKHCTYLNLQEIIAANTLVVHLMVGIICITTTLVLDERKSTFGVNDIRVDFKVDQDSTHRRLAAVRGAGMSQRTRRP